MTQREKVLDKVRKLLALSKSPNEAEATAAAEKAQALLAEYNLTMSEVDLKAETISTDASTATESRPWTRLFATSLAELYFCHYFYVFRKVPTKKRKCGYVRYDVHAFTGAKHNVEVAKLMFSYLVQTIDRLAHEAAKGYSVKERSRFITSFRVACATRIGVRLEERLCKVKTPPAPAERIAGGQQLALANLYSVSQQQVRDYLNSTELGRSLTIKDQKRTISSMAGAIAGDEAGRKISLDTQISDGTKSRLLTNG